MPTVTRFVSMIHNATHTSAKRRMHRYLPDTVPYRTIRYGVMRRRLPGPYIERVRAAPTETARGRPVMRPSCEGETHNSPEASVLAVRSLVRPLVVRDLVRVVVEAVKERVSMPPQSKRSMVLSPLPAAARPSPSSSFGVQRGRRISLKRRRGRGARGSSRWKSTGAPISRNESLTPL